MISVLINFSGHPLNIDARHELERTYSRVIDAKPAEIVFDESIEIQIRQVVSALPVQIDGSFGVTIIPPGQATFAILLVSYLHGVIGHFPNICYLERTNRGIYMPKAECTIQPQDIRAAGRRFRTSQSDL